MRCRRHADHSSVETIHQKQETHHERTVHHSIQARVGRTCAIGWERLRRRLLCRDDRRRRRRRHAGDAVRHARRGHRRRERGDRGRRGRDRHSGRGGDVHRLGIRPRRPHHGRRRGRGQHGHRRRRRLPRLLADLGRRRAEGPHRLQRRVFGRRADGRGHLHGGGARRGLRGRLVRFLLPVQDLRRRHLRQRRPRPPHGFHGQQGPHTVERRRRLGLGPLSVERRRLRELALHGQRGHIVLRLGRLAAPRRRRAPDRCRDGARELHGRPKRPCRRVGEQQQLLRRHRPEELCEDRQLRCLRERPGRGVRGKLRGRLHRRRRMAEQLAELRRPFGVGHGAPREGPPARLPRRREPGLLRRLRRRRLPPGGRRRALRRGLRRAIRRLRHLRDRSCRRRPNAGGLHRHRLPRGLRGAGAGRFRERRLLRHPSRRDLDLHRHSDRRKRELHLQVGLRRRFGRGDDGERRHPAHLRGGRTPLRLRRRFGRRRRDLGRDGGARERDRRRAGAPLRRCGQREPRVPLRHAGQGRRNVCGRLRLPHQHAPGHARSGRRQRRDGPCRRRDPHGGGLRSRGGDHHPGGRSGRHGHRRRRRLPRLLAAFVRRRAQEPLRLQRRVHGRRADRRGRLHGGRARRGLRRCIVRFLPPVQDLRRGHLRQRRPHPPHGLHGQQGAHAVERRRFAKTRSSRATRRPPATTGAPSTAVAAWCT